MNTKTCAILIQKRDATPLEAAAKVDEAIRSGCVCFLSGLEYGAGLDAAEAVLTQKSVHPSLTLECVIPYEEYPSAWEEPDRDRYFEIVRRCDRETMLHCAYVPDWKQRQREYLLQHADIAIVI